MALRKVRVLDVPVTRDTQRPDTIYRQPSGYVFITPDGGGRYWYDNVAEAVADYGFVDDDSVVHCLPEEVDD